MVAIKRGVEHQRQQNVRTSKGTLSASTVTKVYNLDRMKKIAVASDVWELHLCEHFKISHLVNALNSEQFSQSSLKLMLKLASIPTQTGRITIVL